MLEPAQSRGYGTSESGTTSYRETFVRYRETFLRHRLLLSMPMLLTVLVAVWSVLGNQKSYESTASLWVDNSPLAASSVANTNPALPTPAEQEQAVINELLKTRDFRLAVGRRAPLAKYLAAHSGQGWGPLGLLTSLGGGDTLDNRILSALGGKQVSSTVAGPQVLQVSYKGATPAVAAGTLSSLLVQVDQQGARLARLRGRGALAYYKAQVDAASKAGVSARQQVAAYINQHGDAPSDPTLNALKLAERSAGTRLAQATVRLNQASSGLQTPAGAASQVAVVDPPTVPTHTASGRINAVLALLAGLFAGALIGLLGIVALTPGRPDASGVREVPDGSPPSGTAEAPGGAAPSDRPDARSDQFEVWERAFPAAVVPADERAESPVGNTAAEDAPKGTAAQQARARKRTARPNSSAPRSSGNGSSSHASEHTADGANGASDERPEALEDAPKGTAAQQARARKRTARPNSSAPRSSGNGSSSHASEHTADGANGASDERPEALEDAPKGTAAQQARARKRTARPNSSAPRSSGNGSSSHASEHTADGANGASADASRLEASDDT